MAFTTKLPSGKWRGIAKQGRTPLGSKAFTLQRDAQAWAERTEAAAAGGLDVKAGKATIKALLPLWLEHRGHAVAPKTHSSDKELVRALTPGLKARSVASVKTADINTWLLHLHRKGYASSTIARRRTALGSFFTWAVNDNRILENPVRGSRQPAKVDEGSDLRPLTEAELNTVVGTVAADNQTMADIILVLAWTGVRWGEGRALRVSDIQRGPDGSVKSIRVRRSHSENGKPKTTKGRLARTVPVVAVAAPALERLIEGKSSGDLIITGPRGRALWSVTFKAQTGWTQITDGRRPYDLRHTGACLWLSKGVDLGTVSAWLGHANVSTTNLYLHYLGDSADDAAVALINASTMN